MGDKRAHAMLYLILHTQTQAVKHAFFQLLDKEPVNLSDPKMPHTGDA